MDAMGSLKNKSATSQRMPPIARLNLAGPIRLTVLCAVACIGFIAAVAATLPVGARILLAELRLEDTQRVAVRHAKGGIVAQVHVQAGAMVNAGDLLLTLDTRDLDEQIAALKMQAEAATLKLAGVRKEAQLISASSDTSAAAQSRKSELERRLVDVERETIGLQVRIAHAEQDVFRAEVRAPVAGRIINFADLGAGKTISEGAKVAELQPSTTKLVLEGRAIDAHRNDLIPGRSARITLVSPLTHRAETFEARVLEASTAVTPVPAAAERVRLELKTTLEAFNTRIGVNEHLAGELRLGRVDDRAGRHATVGADQAAAGSNKDRS